MFLFPLFGKVLDFLGSAVHGTGGRTGAARQPVPVPVKVKSRRRD